MRTQFVHRLAQVSTVRRMPRAPRLLKRAYVASSFPSGTNNLFGAPLELRTFGEEESHLRATGLPCGFADPYWCRSKAIALLRPSLWMLANSDYCGAAASSGLLTPPPPRARVSPWSFGSVCASWGRAAQHDQVPALTPTGCP